MVRLAGPTAEPPTEGETLHEASARRKRNRRAREAWHYLAYEVCARCGMARINVIHETDPATSPEGPDYYADFVAELHSFVVEPVR